MLKSMTKWFSLHRQEHGGHRRPKTHLRLELLETRELMSWSSVPSTLGWPSSANVSFNSNAQAGTATISSNEIDVYAFVAPRTGTYTFNAGKSGSQIDTVAGLFTWAGNRVAGNDDSNGTTDSRFTAVLTGGTKYAFAITNFTGHSNGGYKWSITGPPLRVNLNNNAGNGITSYGDASLSGNSLTVFLSGINNSNWNTYDHRVDVYLLDGSNKPIHTGSWSLTFRTGGKFVPGIRSANTMTQTFDVSGFDLRNLRNMRIVVA